MSGTPPCEHPPVLVIRVGAGLWEVHEVHDASARKGMLARQLLPRGRQVVTVHAHVAALSFQDPFEVEEARDVEGVDGHDVVKARVAVDDE